MDDDHERGGGAGAAVDCCRCVLGFVLLFDIDCAFEQVIVGQCTEPVRSRELRDIIRMKRDHLWTV